MRVIRYPKRIDWPVLLERPRYDSGRTEESVRTIIEAVRREGDAALHRYTREFDKVEISDMAVGEYEFAAAERRIAPALADAIKLAYANIKKFHAARQNRFKKLKQPPA
jgi:histidinol dehydrogenase